MFNNCCLPSTLLLLHQMNNLENSKHTGQNGWCKLVIQRPHLRSGRQILDFGNFMNVMDITEKGVSKNMSSRRSSLHLFHWFVFGQLFPKQVKIYLMLTDAAMPGSAVTRVLSTVVSLDIAKVDIASFPVRCGRN
jgi:hypothetical protein